MTIFVSAALADTLPTLPCWLAGCGIDHAVGDGAGRRVLAADEPAAGRAGATDIVVRFAEGAPAFVPAAADRPARIAFGFADMAMGHALVAELLRPAGEPALAEPESLALRRMAARVARSDASVLVLGDTGTGKEGLSRFIHARSARADGPFVAVNCAALPEAMLEAMLFGHVRGSFTGATAASVGLFGAAHGGTLMLDELGELPLALQAKLLRAIQEREILPIGATRPIAIDVRIIAASNRDLAAEVEAGRFRADLYWRLAVVPLEIRPLADRRLDIRAIAASLLLRHGRDDIAWPTAAALAALMDHDWTGNARELENVIQRALLLREGDRIEAADLALPAPVPARAAHDLATLADPVVTPLFDAKRRSVRDAVQAALDATGGHRGRAAERLGISERTLRYRLAELRAA